MSHPTNAGNSSSHTRSDKTKQNKAAYDGAGLLSGSAQTQSSAKLQRHLSQPKPSKRGITQRSRYTCAHRGHTLPSPPHSAAPQRPLSRPPAGAPSRRVPARCSSRSHRAQTPPAYAVPQWSVHSDAQVGTYRYDRQRCPPGCSRTHRCMLAARIQGCSHPSR